MNIIPDITKVHTLKKRIDLEVDTQKLDMTVEEISRLKITRQHYRPFLTVICDVYTKQIIGHALTKHAPSAAHPLKRLTFFPRSSLMNGEYDVVIHSDHAWFASASLEEHFRTVNISRTISPQKRSIERSLYRITQALRAMLYISCYKSTAVVTIKSVRLAAISAIHKFNRSNV